MTKLQIGDTAPDFTLLDQDGNSVSLHDFAGSPVILYFYPVAMTPGCTTQACDFRDNLASLTALGYTVLGLSRDDLPLLRKFRERDAITFPLLSDPDRAVHEAYGAWGEKVNYGKTIEGVIRSTFVVDADGKIAHALYNVQATGHVGRLRKLIGAA